MYYRKESIRTITNPRYARSGLPVQEYTPDRDKVSRVYAASMIESGKVWIPKQNKWADDLLTEMLQFPNAAHDDQVDAMTMAIHYMKESWHFNASQKILIGMMMIKKIKKRVAYWRV